MSLKLIQTPQWPISWQVPLGVFAESFPKRTKYCTLIPVINEGVRLIDQLERMQNIGLMKLTDVIIADGGSTDGTNQFTLLDKYDIRSLIIKKDTGKLSAQLRQGYAYAMEQGYEGVVTIDGNGKDSIKSIPAFILALENNLDYVQASRFIFGGKGVNTPFVRKFAICFVHAPLLSIAARKRFTDTTQGFRAYSRRYLLHPKVQPFRDIFQTYELLAYLSVRATQIGLTVSELPTTRIYPNTGPTPTKISPIRGYADLIRILLKTALGTYNPK